MHEGELVPEKRCTLRSGYFFLAGKMRYVATCARPCTFLAWGEQPFDILYERSEDDPRLRASR